MGKQGQLDPGGCREWVPRAGWCWVQEWGENWAGGHHKSGAGTWGGRRTELLGKND